MILKKNHLSLIFLFLFLSCATVKLPFDTPEDRASSALIILGNPIGTYPVTNADIEELINLTKDENPVVRDMAVFQFQQLNNSSYYIDILPLLIDEDFSVARHTEELLLKDSEAAIFVLRQALSVDNKELLIKALDLLVKLNDRKSLPVIIELFNNENPEVVEKAIFAASKLADVGDKILYDTLLRPEVPLRLGMIKTFNKLGDPSVLGTLLPYFYDPELKVRNAVKFVFVDFGKEAIPYLLNVLNNPSPQTQLSVLGLLEALHNENSIDPIIKLFNNENERVKAGAINTVSTFKEMAVQNLGSALRSDDMEIVLNSVHLLGKIKNEDALNYLIPYLNHKNKKIREAVFDSVLLFSEMAGNKLLSIIDRRQEDLYNSAVKGLLQLRDIRLIIDNQASLYNRNNRSRVLILYSSIDDLTFYLNEISLSGLLIRDFTLIKKINLEAALLIDSQKEIRESGSRYTTFYISKNDFHKKSEEAMNLSFTFMRNYMKSKNSEDLEEAKKQQDFSKMFKQAADDLDVQLNNYIGSTDEEKKLIKTFEMSRENILTLYESVSLNRKILADEILSVYDLAYQDIVSGNLNTY
ncbi:MAG: hypothetical protein PF518_07950 [Spirochaetaceae bacterium]|jgi:HEAT repeat protein|nr:hypothetical protein [Spirochaetaceae bacterium]